MAKLLADLQIDTAPCRVCDGAEAVEVIYDGQASPAICQDCRHEIMGAEGQFYRDIGKRIADTFDADDAPAEYVAEEVAPILRMAMRTHGMHSSWPRMFSKVTPWPNDDMLSMRVNDLVPVVHECNPMIAPEVEFWCVNDQESRLGVISLTLGNVSVAQCVPEFEWKRWREADIEKYASRLGIDSRNLNR